MTGLKLLADRVDAKLLSRATAGAAVVTFAAPGLPGSRVCRAEVAGTMRSRSGLLGLRSDA